MDERNASQQPWGPEDYWRIGPVFVRKRLALVLIIGCSVAVLLVFGLPFRASERAERGIPDYRFQDPALAGISDLVRVLDGGGRVRYVGEVAGGAYTGRGKVFNVDGELVYDGPLVDGVCEGADAKVYRSGVLVYTGEMAGNLYEGEGRRFDPDTGIVSEGQFSKGFLEGQGQQFYPGGALLREGTFSRDLLEGEGAEYSEDQILLREGTFSAGLLHGDGREYTADGTLRYEGQFRRGSYHGQGVLSNTRSGGCSVEGTFVYGRPSGQAMLYHSSGQLVYTGQVCGERPRAEAFLGLSLAEVEAAFTTHWLLYTCEGITAFVYPDFHLMFLTESPVPLVSPTQEAEEARRERQELLEALEQPAPENTVPEEAEEAEEPGESPDMPAESEGEGPPAEGEGESPPQQDSMEDITAKMAVTYAAAAPNLELPLPVYYEDEVLAPDADKREILITQVLSYGQPLSGAAQPARDAASVRHRPGWREWFSDFADGKTLWNVSVRHSGQFIWRFIPWPSAQAEGDVTALVTEYAGVETLTVRRRINDMPLWYQIAKRRDGS